MNIAVGRQPELDQELETGELKLENKPEHDHQSQDSLKKADESAKNLVLKIFGETCGSDNDTYRLVSGFLNVIFSNYPKEFLGDFGYSVTDVVTCLNEQLGSFALMISLKNTSPQDYHEIHKMVGSRAEEFGSEVAMTMLENFESKGESDKSNFNFFDINAYLDITTNKFKTKNGVDRVLESRADSIKHPNIFRKSLSNLEQSNKYKNEELFVQESCNSSEDLINKAQANKFEFETMLDFISLQTHSKVVSGIKGADRIESKVQKECDGDYNKIKDTLRASLIFNDRAELLYGLNLLELDHRVESFNFSERMDTEGILDIIDVNRIKCQSDIKVILTLKTGFVCEIQLHLPETHDAKENGVIFDSKILDSNWSGLKDLSYTQFKELGFDYDKDNLSNGFTKEEKEIIEELGESLPEVGERVKSHKFYSIGRKICEENKKEHILALPKNLQTLYLKIKDLEARLMSIPRENIDTNVNAQTAGYLPYFGDKKEATV